MKKVLSLLLILIMFPITAFALIGCNEKKDAKDFYNSYLKIASDSQHLTLTEANDNYNLNIHSEKIVVKHSPQLSTLIADNSKPYRYLDTFYQKLLDDSLAPLYLFGDEISKSNNVSEKQAEKLYSRLGDLEDDYEDIDYYCEILMSSLKSSASESVNLSHLKRLFEQYEQILDSAANLSALVCDIYFNNILTNSNLNYSSKKASELTDTDLTNITINIRSRLYYYKSIYANVYNQRYIKGNKIYENLINMSFTPETYNPYSYISSIKSLTTLPIEELRDNKTDIYNNMLSLYKIQSNISVAYNHFVTASKNIMYNEINENSNTNQISYANIMNQFTNGIAYDSYEIIKNLITLSYI